MPAKLHVFIDTNIFLSFFSYTKDDVQELKKLANLIKVGRLRLYLPSQVHEEFYRNRETKLRESTTRFETSEMGAGVPRFMAGYEETRRYQIAVQQAQKARDEALQRARKEAGERSLAADVLFKQLTTAAKVIHLTDDIYSRACRRMALGNPPGKDRSLGDRINWETLLQYVEDESDLHILSKDGDYHSVLDPSRPKAFLQDEWKQRKNARLFLHAELKPFLTKHYPEIKLADDVEKRTAIDRLKNSGSFTTTHSAVSGLLPYIDVLTNEERNELIKAAQENSQISWISKDEDVSNFYHKVLGSQYASGAITEPEYNGLLELFGVAAPEQGEQVQASDEIPF